MTVKLEPYATVTGRLLNPDGDPISGASLHFSVLPAGRLSGRLPVVTTDAQGRFRNAAVVPGADYSIHPEVPGMFGLPAVSKKLSVKPGETIDLGDVRLKLASGTPATPAEPKSDAKGSAGPAEDAGTARPANDEKVAKPKSAEKSSATFVAESGKTLELGKIVVATRKE